MAGAGSSMLYSFLLLIVILSLQVMYREKLASSEFFTILGGFISSLLFLMSLTFIGNFQESSGMKTGWGAGIRVLLSVVGLHIFCAQIYLCAVFGVKFPEGYNIQASFICVQFILAEGIALGVASTVHRVCITTCFLFSAGLLYEMNKLSGFMLSRTESKSKRH